MRTITAPVPTKLATVLEPYRQKFDPLAKIIPPHIAVIKPFRFSGAPEQLHDHISEVGATHAPIRVSLAGWDASSQTGYHLRLPLITGRLEFTELRNDLLASLLNRPVRPDKDYWPHITFGRFSKPSELEQARKTLKGFEPQFVFRASKLELWQRDTLEQPWKIEKKFALEATALSPPRKKK